MVRLSDQQMAEFVEFSTLIDQLGLFTFETFAAARESVIMSQTEQLLELSTPSSSSGTAYWLCRWLAPLTRPVRRS